MVAPVVAVGVDVVAAEDVVVVFADDGDGGGGHQDQDRGGGVGAADAEVCRQLPWRRVSLPNWSTVSWRMRKWVVAMAVGVALGSAA